MGVVSAEGHDHAHTVVEYDFDHHIGGHHMHYGTYEQVKIRVEYFADTHEGGMAAVARFSRSDRLDEILAAIGPGPAGAGSENAIDSIIA